VPSPRTTDPLALLDALNTQQVEYIVVGGAAAVLHGAPVSTQDLEEARRIRVLDLPTLIQIKATTGRRRDRIVLPILQKLLVLQKLLARRK
jgi:hypothetical protein